MCSRCSHADQAENDDVYTTVHHHSNTIEGRRDAVRFFDGVPDEARVVYYLSLHASPKSTLTGRDREKRPFRKSGQEQVRRKDGEKENILKFS